MADKINPNDELEFEFEVSEAYATTLDDSLNTKVLDMLKLVECFERSSAELVDRNLIDSEQVSVCWKMEFEHVRAIGVGQSVQVLVEIESADGLLVVCKCYALNEGEEFATATIVRKIVEPNDFVSKIKIRCPR